MHAQPGWDDLATFLATARAGGLTGAARALSLHHSTVARRLDRLEADLGVRLFERHARGYDLTEAGQDLLVHARSIEAQVQAIQRKVAAHDQALSGPIRVSTVDDLAVLLLQPMLVDFRAAFPHITVILQTQPEHVDLGRQEADVGLRFGHPGEGDGGLARRILWVDGQLYASRDYAERYGLPTSLAALRDHPIIRGDVRLAGTTLDRFWDDVPGPLNVALRCDSVLVQHAAVIAGLGIAQLSWFTLTPDARVVPVPIPESRSHRAGLWLVRHRDMRHNARVRAFTDFATTWLTERRDRFESPPHP